MIIFAGGAGGGFPSNISNVDWSVLETGAVGYTFVNMSKNSQSKLWMKVKIDKQLFKGLKWLTIHILLHISFV